MRNIQKNKEKILSFKKGHTWSDAHEINVIKKELKSLREHMKYVVKNMDYDDLHASLILPADKGYFNYMKKEINKRKKENYKVILVIGIGGSNLGTMAVQEAILGRTNTKTNKEIYYLDTIDHEYSNRIIKKIKSKKTLIVVISKSGKTTETIVNFEVVKNKLNITNKDIVAITDRDSKLWNYALKNNISVLEIPKLVGGRYSVFSAVGLFPLAMMNIDINKLINGAFEGLKNGLSNNSIAIKSASEIYIHYKSGQNIHNTFLFSNDLESLGKWYRQLMGESLGKEYDLNKKQVFLGITPTYCIGSTDLHSMGQQYLGGPYDTFTTFVSIKKREKIKIKSKTMLVEGIDNKEMKDVIDAILKGAKKAYKKMNRPFVSFELEKLNEMSIGYFMEIKMMEMMFLGHLLNVNPFDQPNVELYKRETRKILK